MGPANAFVNLAPRLIGFRLGGAITAVLGAAIMPWRLLETSDAFVGFLVAYSSLLAPVLGVILADYWVVRRRKLDVDGLYSASAGGPYYYSGGVNFAAMVSARWAQHRLCLNGGFVRPGAALSNAACAYQPAFRKQQAASSSAGTAKPF